MGYYLKIALTMMMIGRIQLSSRDSCKTSTDFQLQADNARADVPVILSDPAQFFSMCAHLCLAHKLCASFNYNDATMNCEALSYKHISSETKRLIHSPGWKFYQKATAKGCLEWQAMKINKDGLGCSCRDLENIALKKFTNQSSTRENDYSSRAVDGDTSNVYEHGSCTGTRVEPSMWWMVDFGQSAIVHVINITNRGDCCGERLSDFNITIGDSAKENGDANPLCVSNAGVPQGATKTFKCASKLTGRYLYIKKNLPYSQDVEDILTLCEVKVFGEFV